MPAISHHHAVYAMIQYLDRNNLEETARSLERESGLFFNMAYFEECFIHGAFDEAEEYMNGFTTVHDNVHSTNVIYEIRWHNFLDSLDDNNLDRAQTILEEELRTFEQYNGGVMSQAVELLSLGNNFRLHPMYRRYGDPVVARASTMPALRRSLESNPTLFGKIYQYPMSRANVGPGRDVVVALPAQTPPLAPPHPAAPVAPPPFPTAPGGDSWIVVPCPHGGFLVRNNNNNNSNEDQAEESEEEDDSEDAEEDNN